MDNHFKVGDRVRRIVEDSPGGTSKKGQEHVIKSVTNSAFYDKEKYGPQKLQFEGQVHGSAVYYSKNYELVIPPAVKTDEELAAEYRSLRQKTVEIGKLLRERGYVISRASDNVVVQSAILPYLLIRKTVTTTKEI